MEDCIFCNIIAGQAQVHKVYEDADCFAFMDKHPINPGHVLVIPKTHVPDFYDISDDMYTNLFLAVKSISKIVKEVYSPDRVGLVLAGYDVPHAHVHIIPMHHRDDITSRAHEGGNRSNPSPEELSDNASKIIQLLS